MNLRSIVVLAVAGIVAAVLTPVTQAESFTLQPGALIQTGMGPLDVGDYAIPCAADWDGDGKKDLLIGHQTAGKIALYLNSGTDAQPAFTNSTVLQAGGVDIQHLASGCGSPAP